MSHRQQRTVASLILERLPATLLLTGTAFVFAIAAGVALGAAAARRVGRITDTIITVLALGFYATPIFWVGLMLVLVFSVWLGWLPSFGMGTVGADLHGFAAVLDVVPYLVLPSLTLGLFYMAVYARLTRASMLEVADQDFVKTARAKGVPEGRILRRHILRNALLPVITFAGIQAGQLIGGSILVETVFAWPGIGRLAFEALLARDYQVLLGVFLCTSVLVVLFNLVTDLLYLVADPRDGDSRDARHSSATAAPRSGSCFCSWSSCMAGAGAGRCFPFSPWDMRGAPFSPPGEDGFLLGSDSLGRDVAAGIAYGA